MNKSKPAKEYIIKEIYDKRKDFFLNQEKKLIKQQEAMKNKERKVLPKLKKIKDSFICNVCENLVTITVKGVTSRKCFKCNFHHIKSKGVWENTGIKTTKDDFKKTHRTPLTIGDMPIKQRSKKKWF